MSNSTGKSFACQFDPLIPFNLNQDIYKKIDFLLSAKNKYWIHFENPSKNLKQQIAKKFSLPKSVALILFSEEVRSRYIKLDSGSILIVHGVQASTMLDDRDFPTLRFWISDQGILSLSTGKINAVKSAQEDIKDETTPMMCLVSILEFLISDLEDALYELDEKLTKIESNLYDIETITSEIMWIRQDIVFLRRYLVPQRDALINISSKLTGISDDIHSSLKELSDSMLRQVEAIQMLLDRSVILQDNITNQIGELSNRRMYVLTIIMLIFTPAFFIMGLFSMYLPIPGMTNKLTWWLVVGLIVVVSYSLYKVFKLKKWL